MINQLLSAVPVTTLEIAFGEGAEQQLGLIKPGGVHGGKHDPDSVAVLTQTAVRVLGDVTGTIIPNQMKTSHLRIVLEQLGQDLTEVLAIIVFQTPPVHLSAMDDQRDQEIDRTVADVLKFLVFNLPGPHRAGIAPAPGYWAFHPNR